MYVYHSVVITTYTTNKITISTIPCTVLTNKLENFIFAAVYNNILIMFTCFTISIATRRSWSSEESI